MCAWVCAYECAYACVRAHMFTTNTWNYYVRPITISSSLLDHYQNEIRILITRIKGIYVYALVHVFTPNEKYN